MEDDQQMSMAGVGRLSRPQKLKDTCDMCSTSKVRCDKTKPTCSRCERLSYPCFYSPAQRMRKRRCIQCMRSSGNLAEAEEQLSEAAPTATTTTAARDESVATDSNVSGDGAESSFRHSFKGANSLQPQTTEPYASTLSSDDKTNTHNSSSSDSSTIEAMLPGLECSKPIPSKSDCVTVATNILEHLNTTRGIEACFPAGPKAPAATLEASISSVSLAIKRVSTILICPCSKNPNVGLLAAAVCAALLDTYEIILRNSTRPHTAAGYSSYSPSMNNRAGSQRASTKPMLEVAGMKSSGSVDELDERATIMQIRDELPMVANLVTQFTKRYNQDAEMCSKDLLQGLALSITGRLRVMIDEVTSWMAQI